MDDATSLPTTSVIKEETEDPSHCIQIDVPTPTVSVEPIEPGRSVEREQSNENAEDVKLEDIVEEESPLIQESVPNHEEADVKASGWSTASTITTDAAEVKADAFSSHRSGQLSHEPNSAYASVPLAESTGAISRGVDIGGYSYTDPRHPHRLIIDGVPYHMTEKDIWDAIEVMCGEGGLVHVRVMLDRSKSQRRYQKGYAYLVFSDDVSVQKVLMQKNLTMNGRITTVKRMSPTELIPPTASDPPFVHAPPPKSSHKSRRRRDSGASVDRSPQDDLFNSQVEVPPENKLFLGDVYPPVTGQDLLNEFSKYGKIRRVAIVKDKKTDKCKGYAFIYYASPDGPQKAMAASRFVNLGPKGSFIEVKPFTGLQRDQKRAEKRGEVVFRHQPDAPPEGYLEQSRPPLARERDRDSSRQSFRGHPSFDSFPLRDHSRAMPYGGYPADPPETVSRKRPRSVERRRGDPFHERRKEALHRPAARWPEDQLAAAPPFTHDPRYPPPQMYHPTRYLRPEGPEEKWAPPPVYEPYDAWSQPPPGYFPEGARAPPHHRHDGRFPQERAQGQRFFAPPQQLYEAPPMEAHQLVRPSWAYTPTDTTEGSSGTPPWAK
eukprot:GHVH01006429.1.p1 GENE.GHVH01006429.1~~GHVH01006429.1.p1  ORF type:complete len:604 (+),score=78.54 GHVH01006429.1:462-2273(+)